MYQCPTWLPGDILHVAHLFPLQCMQGRVFSGSGLVCLLFLQVMYQSTAGNSGRVQGIVGWIPGEVHRHTIRSELCDCIICICILGLHLINCIMCLCPCNSKDRYRRFNFRNRQRLFIHTTSDFHASHPSLLCSLIAFTRRVAYLFCACWLSWWWQPCPSVEEWAPLRKSTGWWCPLCYCLWPSASTGPFSCHMRLRELCTSSLQTGVGVHESTKHGGTAVLWWRWFVLVLSVQVNLRPCTDVVHVVADDEVD